MGRWCENDVTIVFGGELQLNLFCGDEISCRSRVGSQVTVEKLSAMHRRDGICCSILDICFACLQLVSHLIAPCAGTEVRFTLPLGVTGSHRQRAG